MTSNVGAAHSGAAGKSTAKAGGMGSGWLLFAGAMMIIGGFIGIVEGIAALANDEVFIYTRNYIYAFDLTGWGWIHVILGAFVVCAGAAVLQDHKWARIAGVVLASLVMIVNFMWLPYAPFWALILIALDIIIIWALCMAPHPEHV
ncbi:hypothetical protein [Streptomyces sp. NPDC002054]|uniref:DUF7144 family membrane protein n=1 Tax=Streptomyces sp. NPDC002054 TaxID=3154663 RepID=UPI0033265CEF